AMLSAASRDLVVQVQLVFGLGTHIGGIVPSQFAHRFRQLLEPAVVGEAAVVYARVRPEDEFVLPGGYGSRGREAPRIHLGADAGERGKSRVGNKSVVQRLAPELLKRRVIAGSLRFQAPA